MSASFLNQGGYDTTLVYVVRLRRGVSGVWLDQDLLLEQPDEREESRVRGLEGSGKNARPAEWGTRYAFRQSERVIAVLKALSSFSALQYSAGLSFVYVDTLC